MIDIRGHKLELRHIQLARRKNRNHQYHCDNRVLDFLSNLQIISYSEFMSSIFDDL